MSYCFKIAILAEIGTKMHYFYWKFAKIAQRCGLRKSWLRHFAT